mmetsp:Transcript_4937/g.5713  ORF Transcript_4937/g.5713 Transcript_4937/m.5713 type:complete len:115 (-) Transcript_4937:81-425(-)
MAEKKEDTQLDAIGRATAQLKKAWNAAPSQGVPSELVFNEKFERCAENMLVTGGAGLLAGTIASLVFFRRGAMRGFAIGVGTGVGIGSSYTTCQYKVYGSTNTCNITDKASLDE